MNVLRNNSAGDEMCSVPRKRFFELQDMLYGLSERTRYVMREVDALATMIAGDQALLMYREQKQRADRAEEEISTLLQSGGGRR